MTKWRYLLAAGTVLSMWPIGLAHAQDSSTNAQPETLPSSGADAASTDLASQGDSIADIVVTAERRAQSVQKVPLTIQVLSGDDLLSEGVTSVQSLAKVAPGVVVGMGAGYSQVFIRGVGGYIFSPLAEGGVAFHVDGVYIGRPTGLNGSFYDLARVEIVKGPQGTLYGRNATGGAINVLTNEPRLGVRSLDLNFEAGNYALAHASGAVNLPVGDTAAVRAAFNVVHRNGYLSDGTSDDVEQAGRLRFKWQPDPDLTLVLTGNYIHLGGKGTGYVYLPQRPGSDPYEGTATPAANAYFRSISTVGAAFPEQLPDHFQDTTLFDLSAQLDWRLGDFATLTVLPAYRRSDVHFLSHIGNRQEVQGKDHQVSVETRLGNSAPGLTWVVGGYYYHDGAPNNTVDIRVTPTIQNIKYTYFPYNTAYAAFGQATVGLFDGFRVIGGARYTYERKKLDATLLNRANGSVQPFSTRKNFDGFSYKVGAEYDAGPSNLLYATYSNGFRSGGLVTAAAPFDVYQPEYLNAFEIGSRNRFLDNRLQFNASAFYWKYKDIQDQRGLITPAGIQQLVTFNVGDAAIYGGTIDIIARLTPSDTLSLIGEYAHSRYDTFFFKTPAAPFRAASTGCAVSGPFAPGANLPYTDSLGNSTNTTPVPLVVGDCSGRQVARTPKWSGTVSYEHVFTLADTATVTFGGSVKYTSARWLHIDFVASERDAAYALVDLDLTYRSPDRRWSVGLFGRNLGDSVYYLGGGPQIGTAPGYYISNIGAPRTFGIQAGFRFGE